MAKFQVNQDPTQAIWTIIRNYRFTQNCFNNCSTGDFSRSSGDLPLWRRWVLYANGRLSLKQLKLSIKVIVFSNSSLTFVELEMKSAGFLTHAPDLAETDFLKLAKGVVS
jgi:hypothetical protein